jgi:hypothetical protein
LMQTLRGPTNGHDQQARTIQYVRLNLMLAVILLSLTGWWRNFMISDWMACELAFILNSPRLFRQT